MSIRVQNVSKFYGSQAALKNISFEVKKGEVVGFLGPNGAGKSTMMKIITTYIPSDNGSVEVSGFNVDSKPIDVRKRVGYLPESNPLYYEMYIREYLSFVGGLYGISGRKRRVEEMIEMVGLTPESHKKIGELSKGYKQRVGLAQAMLHDPEVLILDEPTSGLDPNQLEDIRNLIQSLGKEKSVLLSTHIMQEVEAICDRVIIIKNGEIVADDQMAQLKEEREVEVVFFHVSDKLNTDLISSISGVIKVRGVEKGQYIVSAKKGGGIIGELSKLATKKGLDIEEIRKEEKSLEDVFKSLTK
ncbi:MAG: gliding motility-associated ABC transporter ATP-binding subunit GldA [Flavobacteriales bacterium]|nr:gliding motility-associated ABC transporter ATP-binding subunit GldA [Flavobacteriales bacterium]